MAPASGLIAWLKEKSEKAIGHPGSQHSMPPMWMHYPTNPKKSTCKQKTSLAIRLKRLLGARTLLGAGIATSSKKPLGAPGLTTRSNEAQ